MPGLTETAQLLVEGKHDQHVIWALCKQHQIPETFTVEVPGDPDGGIEQLLESIPVRLKISRLRAIGIVLDANQNLQGRWEAVCSRLRSAGYSSLPREAIHTGTVIETTGKPRIGIWLMPDNQLPGELENFVAHLIPENDFLAAKAEATLLEIEQANLNQYSLTDHPKAFIHTWLAWQKTPGQPMGQAITAGVLRHNRPLAISFVNWLRQLFG
ncbi:MAG: DUF3226 domain-containing protein [Chloroflexota bacterium]